MPCARGGVDGAALLLSLPDDVLALVSAHLRPRDLCALALSSRALHALVASSDKAWLAQCLRAPRRPPPYLLPRWRAALPSYRAACRFLHSAAPLLGVWVHQNPELGNVVLALWGLASLVFCRVLPQEMAPAGPLLWAPVFELLPGPDGSPSLLFLHGRDSDGADALSPGSLSAFHPSPNVLLLEIDAYTPSHNSSTSSSSSSSSSSFVRLAFGDRRRLLELVATKARIKLPAELTAAPLFPGDSSCDDAALLEERRAMLVKLHELHGGCIDRGTAELHLESMAAPSGNLDSDGPTRARRSKMRSLLSVAGYFKDGVKQLLARSRSLNDIGGVSRNSGGLARGESKHVPLHEFLRAGDTLGLSLRVVSMKLSTYRGWPNMPDNKFALYKLPVKSPDAGREYAGLWGGTFGWPPGRTSEDKPGKALFLLLISYEEVEGKLLLISTKILEGTHYVLHPNGSAMFIVKVDEPALEPFPWEFDSNSLPIEVKQAYSGEGIASGYGFRYPGSKPGSLFVMQNGIIAFVWKDSKAVLTLQRMDLQELLKKGERVPTLPQVANFAYLTKSYSNVFAGFPSNPACSSIPRSATPVFN